MLTIKHTSFLKLLLLGIFCLGVSLKNIAYAGTLSCSVTTAAACSGTVILRMSGSTNAHAELPGQATAAYDDNVVCCSGVTGLGNSCSGTTATILKLSGVTNAHVEQNTQNNFANDACMSVGSGGTVSVGYQPTNCSGYDTTLASMPAVTNAHVGDTTAYSEYKICGTAAAPQSLTFSISDNTVGFGPLTPSGPRYATGNTNGSSSDSADSHTLSVATNAADGYAVTLSSAALACSICGPAEISAIGDTAAASSSGTEQFGARLTVNSGTGSVSSPYNGTDWALHASNSPVVVATGSGDGATTEFGVRYLGNIAANTESGSYSSTITYTVTATF